MENMLPPKSIPTADEVQQQEQQKNLPLDLMGQTEGNIGVPLDEQVNGQITPEESLATASGQDLTDSSLIFWGKDYLDPKSAKDKAVSDSSITMEGIIDNFWNTGEEPDINKIQATAEEQQKTMDEMLDNPDFVYEQVAAYMGKDANPTDVRMATNQEIGRRIVSDLKAREESSSTVGGIVDAVVDFGAMLARETTVGIVESLGGRTSVKGTEILLKRSQLPPKEFKAWFNDYAESVYSESLVSGNAWQIDQLEEELEGLGIDRLDTFKKVFAIADLIGLKGATVVASGAGKAAVKGASRISEALLTKSTKTRRIAVVEGNEVAAEKAIARAEAGDGEALSDIGPAINNPAGAKSSPMNAPEGIAARKAQHNVLAKEIEQQSSSGTLAKVLTPEEVDFAKAKFVDNLDAKVSNRLLFNDVVESGLGRFYHLARLGTDNNTSFLPVGKAMAPPKAATNLAKKINDGGLPAEVIPVDINDLSKGYVVEMKQNLKVRETLGSGEIDLAQMDKISRVGIGKLLESVGMGKLFSSSAWRDTRAIQALGFRGEQGKKVLNNIVTSHMKIAKKLSLEQSDGINRVMNKLRNGEDAARRERYNDLDFKYEYENLTTQKMTDDVLEAYHALSDVEDTAWTLAANERLVQYVDKGFKAVAVDNGIHLPAKRVSNVADLGDDVLIADIKGGIDITKSRLSAKNVVFKLDKPWVSKSGETVEHVTMPNKITELEPEDVLGYNPGGTRLNEDAKYFVVADAGNRSKTLFSAMTEKQAKIGTEEVNTLMKAGDDLTDDLVQSNNSFRPELNTVDDFMNWAKELRLDLSSKGVFYKDRDQSVTLGNAEITSASPALGGNFGDWLANDLRRENRVLDQYGGGKVLNADPMTAIMRQFDSRLQEHSMRAYTLRSQTEWVKKALRQGKNDWFPSDLVGSKDYYRMFMNATPTGNTEFAIRMKELQNTYKRRMGHKGPLSSYIDEAGSKLSEYVLDNTGIKTGNIGLTNKMMSIGFQSAFGFLNVAQLILQASHAATIIAISPRAGAKGASLALTTRAILATADTEVYNFMRKNLAKNYGITEKQVDELLEIQKSSGRSNVDGDILEDGTGTGVGWSSFGSESNLPTSMRKAMKVGSEGVSKGLDAGLVFFNMGERMASRTSLYTASLEYLKNNKNASLLTEQARNWIAKRDQDLSFAMSNHARSTVQSGMMKVPTQWLSHSMRSMEAVLIGRGFTKMERLRMATAMGPALGLNGMGMTYAADNINEYLGFETDSAYYTTLKWGVYDGFMDAMLPEGEGEGRAGIGFSTRMAPISAFTDLYDKVFGERTNLASALAGPSGEITKSLAEAVFNALGSLKNGHDITLTEDLIKVLRQPSAIDSFAKAAGILSDGVYRSKNGVVIPGKMTSSEAVMQFMGVGSLKQQEYYDLRTQMFKEGKSQASFRKELKASIGKVHTLLYGTDADSASIAKGVELIKELQLRIQYSNYPPEVQRSLRKSVFKGLTDDLDKMNKFLIRNEKTEDFKRLNSVIQ